MRFGIWKHRLGQEVSSSAESVACHVGGETGRDLCLDREADVGGDFLSNSSSRSSCPSVFVSGLGGAAAARARLAILLMQLDQASIDQGSWV